MGDIGTLPLIIGSAMAAARCQDGRYHALSNSVYSTIILSGKNIRSIDNIEYKHGLDGFVESAAEEIATNECRGVVPLMPVCILSCIYSGLSVVNVVSGPDKPNPRNYGIYGIKERGMILLYGQMIEYDPDATNPKQTPTLLPKITADYLIFDPRYVEARAVFTSKPDFKRQTWLAVDHARVQLKGMRGDERKALAKTINLTERILSSI
ncbi:MAG: hypothetical protein ABIJ08_07595 [Nanoarchaeota archaeon]